MLETMLMYFQYPFVRYACIAGVLIALCASLCGVILVLKQYSYLGDGLSHVAFGAMAVASVLKVTNNMLIIMPITVASAVLMLKSGEKRRVNGDAMIAIVSVSSLAVGYLLMNVFSTGPNIAGDVCSTLFGSTSILTLKPLDVWLCIGLSVVVVFVYLCLYRKIFLVTFDERFAKATGTNADRYNLVIAILTAVTIVLAMNLAGSLLISALIVFPTLSAMRLFHGFKQVVITSAIFAMVCAIVGLLVSILAGTPVGATIVVTDLIVFGVTSIVGGYCK